MKAKCLNCPYCEQKVFNYSGCSETIACDFYKKHLGFKLKTGKYNKFRIIDECKKNHCALPEWRQDDNTVTLTFKAELPRDKFTKSTITDNIIKGLTHNVDAQQHLYAIYMSIRNNGNIKVANVQELTGKSYISCKRYLQLLKEAGLIEYRGSLKTGGWYTVSQ